MGGKRHWVSKAINGYLNMKVLCCIINQSNKRSPHTELDFFFTTRFLQNRREYNAIHKSINAR